MEVTEITCKDTCRTFRYAVAPDVDDTNVKQRDPHKESYLSVKQRDLHTESYL